MKIPSSDVDYLEENLEKIYQAFLIIRSGSSLKYDIYFSSNVRFIIEVINPNTYLGGLVCSTRKVADMDLSVDSIAAYRSDSLKDVISSLIKLKDSFAQQVLLRGE
jgi:hypothetical protein